uniref:HAT C-terminal dimerisation domain-containing protein n=1 Tax=Amphimedon queenslandica TaxID=400682 RepID=A0A1X7UW54_AMPQE
MALDYLLGPQSEISIVTVREELHSYQAEMEPSRETSPSMWWKDNSKRFPLLSQVAMDFLHTPATSTPSERIFSTVGNTVTQKRNCLTNQ